jgi:quinol monooxygenase YgiN
MIVIHAQYTYPVDEDPRMRDLAPGVERFCRTFDGCEAFTLSYPADRDGVLLSTEVWRDSAAVMAHLKAAHDAPELAAWHTLIEGTDFTIYDGSAISLDQLRGQAPQGPRS